MAPSGEACLVRDGEDRIWLSSIYVGNREITVEEADHLIAKQDWIRIDETFGSWPALVAYRRARVAAAPALTGVEDYSGDEVWNVLEETQTADSPVEREAARILLLMMLRRSAVLYTDEPLRTAVVDRVDQLTDLTPVFESIPTPEFAEAMDRLALVG
jgi:hypothetical protein